MSHANTKKEIVIMRSHYAKRMLLHEVVYCLCLFWKFILTVMHWMISILLTLFYCFNVMYRLIWSQKLIKHVKNSYLIISNSFIPLTRWIHIYFKLDSRTYNHYSSFRWVAIFSFLPVYISLSSFKLVFLVHRGRNHGCLWHHRTYRWTHVDSWSPGWNY